MAVPNWLSSANVGEWGVIPGGSLVASGVGWAGSPPGPGGAGNYVKVIDAWGGMIVNTTGVYDDATFIPGTFLCFWGGGHGDYYGNEMYAFGPLEDETPAWLRITDPTLPPPLNVGEDGSGNPVARHTYNTLEYVGTGGRNWLFSSGVLFRASDANSNSISHYFDFGIASPRTNLAWAKKANPVGACQVSAFDPTTGYIWSNPYANNTIQRYDVATNTYISANFKSPGWGSNPSSAIDTVRGIWAIYGNGTLNFYRLNNGTGNDYYAPSVTGTAPTGTGSILYDPTDDSFKVWNGGGKKIFTLRAPASNPYQGGNAWTWTSDTPASGSTPSAQHANGTHSRWRTAIIETSRFHVLLNGPSESVYFYKVSGDPPPSGPYTQEGIHAAIAALRGSSGQFNEDLHWYLTSQGIPTGQIGERLLAWAQGQDSTVRTASAAYNYLLQNGLS